MDHLRGQCVVLGRLNKPLTPYSVVDLRAGRFPPFVCSLTSNPNARPTPTDHTMHRPQSLLQHAVAMHYSGAAALTQPQTRTTTPLHSSSTATLSPAGQERLDSSSTATLSPAGQKRLDSLVDAASLAHFGTSTWSRRAREPRPVAKALPKEPPSPSSIIEPLAETHRPCLPSPGRRSRAKLALESPQHIQRCWVLLLEQQIAAAA